MIIPDSSYFHHASFRTSRWAPLATLHDILAAQTTLYTKKLIVIHDVGQRDVASHPTPRPPRGPSLAGSLAILRCSEQRLARANSSHPSHPAPVLRPGISWQALQCAIPMALLTTPQLIAPSGLNSLALVAISTSARPCCSYSTQRSCYRTAL